jgi:hypothetical protein
LFFFAPFKVLAHAVFDVVIDDEIEFGVGVTVMTRAFYMS